ncbi:MAG: peptidase M61 [Planctomycetota bacterium]|nr:MAG: peptidase M61 [Planctomycetota bacterium]
MKILPLLAAAICMVALSSPLDAAPLRTVTSQESASVTEYLIRLPDRQAHRVHVRLQVSDLEGDTVNVSMPVWTPGSYLVREYSRHVLDFAASTPDGAPLAASKTAKNTWEVQLNGAHELVVDYQLYANELSVRTNHVNAEHAFLSPAATFLRVPERDDQPLSVRVETPEDWEVYTELRQRGEGANASWYAADYDTLVDAPFEIGPHREERFEVNGVPHRLVIAGEGVVDTERLATDLQRVSEEVATIFGNMPFDDYTVILVLTDGQGGGLEHKNSNVSMVSRWAFTDDDRYRGLIELLAHEYFHAWNVKRFRPAALGPFDYDAENYTGDLWTAEGITSYFDELSTLRAGFGNVNKYFESRAKAFRNESERPGSGRMSLLESSFDAWIKLYRPDENSTNSAISYYSKGALVCLMLDLRMQRLSEGRVSLRDALRLGWERYTERGVGFPEGAVEQLVNEVVGQPLDAFFDAYVQGTAPLNPNEDLAWVGIELVKTPAENTRKLPLDEHGQPLEAWLGIQTAEADGLVRIASVIEGSPAFSAGLNHDDLILALDDLRVTPSTYQDRLDRLAGQRSIKVTLYRGQRMQQLFVDPEHRPLLDWKIQALDEVDAATQERFAQWTLWDHPSVENGGHRGAR